MSSDGLGRLAVFLFAMGWTSIASGLCQSQGAEPRISTGFRVVSAGRIVAGAGSDSQAFLLGGVWTPSPAAGHWPGDYRGDEARDRVHSLVQKPGTTISRRWNPRGGSEPLVRLLVPAPSSESPPPSLVGEDEMRLDRVDLAVLLALEGLALCDRTTASDRRHADAICEAERVARRQRRGLHDGGFLDFRSRRDVVEIGELPETLPSVSEESTDRGWWASDDADWMLRPRVPLDRPEKIPSVRRREKGKKGGSGRHR
jgi:hypothetical protein